MNLHYAANLSMLWPDRPMLERFDAAAAAGFTRVEMLFPQQLDREVLLSALDRNGLTMTLFDFNAGDWEAGERGIAAYADRVHEFRQGSERDLELAGMLGTRTMTVLAGIGGNGRKTGDDVLVDNLRHISDPAAEMGITVTVEAINGQDVAGFHVRTVDHAAAIVSVVDRPNVRIQFDQYHVCREMQDPVFQLERHFPHIAHVQIADSPGRHEPGTGTAPIRQFLERLGQLGYEGNVGLEYQPSGDTDATLGWLRRDARG